MRAILALLALAASCTDPEQVAATDSAVFSIGRTYNIVNAASGRCMDVAGASTAPGAWVNQFTCHGNQNQVWRIESTPECRDGSGSCSYNLIRSMNSNLCLEVDIAGRLHQASCAAVDGQRFIIWEPISSFGGSHLHAIQRKNTFQCLDVENASPDAGAKINAFGCHAHANQVWLFQTRSDAGV